MPATRFDKFRNPKKPGDDLGALILGTAALRGVNQKTLAAVAGIAASTLCDKKNNDFGTLSFNQIVRMCKHLGITRESFAAAVPLKKEVSP